MAVLARQFDSATQQLKAAEAQIQQLEHQPPSANAIGECQVHHPKVFADAKSGEKCRQLYLDSVDECEALKVPALRVLFGKDGSQALPAGPSWANL